MNHARSKDSPVSLSCSPAPSSSTSYFFLSCSSFLPCVLFFLLFSSLLSLFFFALSLSFFLLFLLFRTAEHIPEHIPCHVQHIHSNPTKHRVDKRHFTVNDSSSHNHHIHIMSKTVHSFIMVGIAVCFICYASYSRYTRCLRSSSRHDVTSKDPSRQISPALTPEVSLPVKPILRHTHHGKKKSAVQDQGRHQASVICPIPSVSEIPPVPSMQSFHPLLLRPTSASPTLARAKNKNPAKLSKSPSPAYPPPLEEQINAVQSMVLNVSFSPSHPERKLKEKREGNASSSDVE